MLFERIKLEDDEKMLMVVRKHWWIIATRCAAALLITFTPLLVYVFIKAFAPAVIVEKMIPYTQELIFSYLGWILINWMLVANFFTDHYLDLWAITNRRIVAIDQRGFFHRFLSSFRLERLQDMNIEVKGIIPTLLNFGSIEAQTAGGSNEEFMTENMPDPRGLKALIIQAADERQRITKADFFNTDGTL